MNKVFLIGRLTADPEKRKSQNQLSICRFTLAVDRGYKDANGDKPTDFLPVVAWRNLADNCMLYLKKGKQCAVSGSVQTRSWEGSDGNKRSVTEIVADNVEFLSPANNGSNGQDNVPMPQDAPPQRTRLEDLTQLDDDDLPF